MSKEILIRLRDDLDGSMGDDVETIPFAYRGVAYEIELSPANAAYMDSRIAPFIDAGRKAPPPPKKAKKKPVPAPAPVMPANGGAKVYSKAQRDAIRAWANENGIPVAEKGYLPRAAIDAYERGCTHPRIYKSGARQGECRTCHQQVEEK